MGWPVTYFDHYANPIAKPVFNKAIPEGLTASQVMNNYINAIGGRDLLESVNTLVQKADVTIPAPFKPQATIKQMVPNKYSMKMEANMNGQTMKLGGMSFDGETGYNEGPQGRSTLDEKVINDLKAVKGIFPELYYSEDEIELISINSIDFKDAYKVKITEDKKVSYRYYSVDSSLLLSGEEQDDNNNITSQNYGDYRDVCLLYTSPSPRD